jgi:hypothetical protein
MVERSVSNQTRGVTSHPRVLSLAVFLWLVCLGGVASAQRFTWAEYAEGDLPPGNYLTPVKNQNISCCFGGCALFAAIGAMESVFKIEQGDPGLTLFLTGSSAGACPRPRSTEPPVVRGHGKARKPRSRPRLRLRLRCGSDDSTHDSHRAEFPV